MKKVSIFTPVAATIFITACLAGCSLFRPKIIESDKVPEVDKTREAKMLTAFFGLDNGLTRQANLI